MSQSITADMAEVAVVLDKLETVDRLSRNDMKRDMDRKFGKISNFLLAFSGGSLAFMFLYLLVRVGVIFEWEIVVIKLSLLLIVFCVLVSMILPIIVAIVEIVNFKKYRRNDFMKEFDHGVNGVVLLSEFSIDSLRLASIWLNKKLVRSSGFVNRLWIVLPVAIALITLAVDFFNKVDLGVLESLNEITFFSDFVLPPAFKNGAICAFVAWLVVAAIGLVYVHRRLSTFRYRCDILDFAIAQREAAQG